MMRLALLPLLALLVATVATVADAAVFNPFQAARIDQRPDAQLPLDTVFTDQNDRPVTLGGMIGNRPTLLIPLLHNCPNICGVTLSGVMEAIRAQKYRSGQDFEIVAMSIDPRETPADARNAMAELKRRYPTLAGTVHALTGSSHAIADITGKLGYIYGWDDEIGQYAHVAATAVVTPQGRLSRWLYGLQPAADDVELALTEAGRGQIGSWGDQLLLLCYHYDPTTGRYSPIVWTALRVGGGMTAFLMLGWLAFTFRKERREAERGPDA